MRTHRRRLSAVLMAAFLLLAFAGVRGADAAGKSNPNPPGQLPGCNPSDQQPNKCDEGPPPPPDQCHDGIDNDGDGLTDSQDPDCANGGTTEGTPQDQCHDGIDNDGDGLTDSQDPDCANGGTSEGTPPPDQCHDGIDNDGDGLTDSQDPDCANGGTTEGTPQDQCHDGIDNDGDGLTDSADPDCANGGTSEGTPPPAPTCATGGLADGTGLPLVDPPGSILNSDKSETGPLSGPLHNQLEPQIDGLAPVVHEVNCTVVVSLGL